MMKAHSYSQAGQDLIAHRFFKCYPPNSRFFIDVGAFDGINYSNTRLFFDHGWKGLCLEPVEKNYQKLEDAYRNTKVETLQVAAADYDGLMELNVATIPWAPEWGSDVSTTSEQARQKWDNYVWTKETVAVTTLDALLAARQVESVAYISIDVEGSEVAVLRGFDLEKYNPALIIVEYSDQSERDELISHTEPKGYFLWHDNHQDLFFVSGSIFDYPLLIPGYLWQKIMGVKWFRCLRRN